jgi:uncharacterized protein (DUF934 family)
MKVIDAHQDRWHTVAGEDGPMVTLTPKAYSLLSFLQWHAVRAHWPQDLPVGVVLENDVQVQNLHEDWSRLALVVLQFPKWVDGRAYSQARLLRSRLKFVGEVRAAGEVLVDMLPLLARSGFDAVVLRSDQDLQAAQKALGFFVNHYQGDAFGQRDFSQKVA